MAENIEELRGALTGDTPRLEPDLAKIEAHLHASFDDVPTEFEDGLIEIAYGISDVAQARLFEVGELVEAAKFAHDVNLRGNNTYFGVALRKPETTRAGRTTDADAYAVGQAWFDADARLEGVRVRVGELGVCVTAAVVTGTTPEPRAQGQVSLDQWTDELGDVVDANKLLATALGTDSAVTNIGRVMRLGGTVNYPSTRKLKRGYIAERTQLWIADDVAAHNLDALATTLRGATANGEDKTGGADTGSGPVDLDAEIALCKANDGTWHQAMKRCLAHLYGKGWEVGRATEYLKTAGAIPEDLDADYAKMLAWFVAQQPGIVDMRPRDKLPEFEPIETPPPDPEDAWTPTLPPGLVGDLAKYGANIAYVEAPIAALAGALIAASTLCGKRAAVAMRRGPVPLNLFVDVLAPSGKGKDTVRRVIAHALDAADMADVSSRPSSNAALHKHLCDTGGRAYLFMDEFGHTLKFAASNAGGHQQGVLTFATELFGMALGVLPKRGYASQKAMDKVERPYVTVAALSVAEPVIDALSSKHVIDGTLNRYLTFIEPGGGHVEEPAKPMSRDLKTKCANLGSAIWVKMGDEAVTVDEGTRSFWAIIPTKEAHKHLVAFRDACERHQGDAGDLKHLWVRSYEIAVRVAGVVAMGCYERDRLNPELTLEHAQWATDLVERLTRQTCSLIGDNLADSETERDAKKMLKFIRDVISNPRKGKWYDLNKQGVAPRSQVVNAFHRIEKWKRDQIIESLVEGQNIAVGKFTKDGELDGRTVGSGVLYRPL